jgi:predicted NodU family carbamoyl transferase
LSIDGKIECVLSEERLIRLKNAQGFPFEALQYVVNKYLNGDKTKITKVVLNDIDLTGVQALECWGYKPKRHQGYYCYSNKKWLKKFLKRRSLLGKLKKISHGGKNALTHLEIAR